jgi:addiction module HigA family antidote
MEMLMTLKSSTTIRGEQDMAKRFAIHPGEILLSEFMEPMGLSAYRVAKDLGVPLPRIYDIVKGKRSISADTALRLGVYFGLPAQFWMNLQNDFDLRTAHTPGVTQIRPYKAA